MAAGASVAVACVLTADAMIHLRGQGPIRDQFLQFILLATALLVASAIHVNLGIRVISNPKPQRVFLILLPLVLAILSVGRTASRFHQVANVVPLEDWNLPLAPPGAFYTIEDFMVVTDKGSRLPVFGWNVSDEEFRTFSTMTEKNYSEKYQLIRREVSLEESNCHGWVFTEGKYLLFGEQVEQILRENGYRVVEKPVVGDIIVYRNISGAVLHSGLVRSVFDDGAVLIESKWGIGARYLHQPLDQPYGDLFRYYHTDRGNHSVYVVARSDEESP